MQLLHSLSLASSTLADVLETRLRLFLAEVQLERLRVTRMIVFAIIGAGSLVLALMSGVALIVFVAPPEHRALILAILTGSLFLIGVICLALGLRRTIKGTEAFAASREALRKDRECLASLTRK